MSNVKFYNGKHYQGNMTDASAEAILSLIENYSSVTSLKNVIKNAPYYIIEDKKNEAMDYLATNGSLKGYNIDFSEDLESGSLRDEQTLGVAFLYYAGSALLGDEVGLGKTVQIAGLANLLRKNYASQGKKFRYLFLTEKTTTDQIRNKLMQFTGEYVDLLGSAEKKELQGYLEANKEERYASLVGSHSLLDSAEFLTHCAKHKFDAVIIDEGAILKKTTSSVYTNCKALFKHTNRKIILNATPIEIELRDMYNQLKLLDKDFLPTVSDFNRLFIKYKKTPRGFEPDGFKNEEMFKEAVKLRYIARTRAQLGAKYTDNLYKTIFVPLSSEQSTLMRKTTLYSMVADYPKGVSRDVPFDEHTTPKLQVLNYILEQKVKNGSSQALVYCRFVEAQNDIKAYLESKGYRVAILNGKVNKKGARDEIVSDFNKGYYDVMLTNVLRGLDLDVCDTCILYTIDPNPQKMVQFEGRMTRGFDIENKSVYLLVAMGKEKKNVESKLKMRVDASASFSNTGNSMVLEAIQSDNNKVLFDRENNDMDNS